MNDFGQTICLNMIVKNEAPVIQRCLETVRPLIDHWIIVDTGSTDGTQEIIREHFSGIPGELIECPWVDFAHNRSEAIDLAQGKSDYLFFIDADETLEIETGFQLPKLEADSYNLTINYAGCTYLRRQLVKNSLPWRYVGVLHEYIQCDSARIEGFLPGLQTYPHPDGARARDPNTYRNDALILEKSLIEGPDNHRNVFYLAQSYRDAGDFELAIRNYKRRAEMGGWPEEVWYSLYQIAHIGERMEKAWSEVFADYLAAYEFKPDRVEPLYRIGIHFQSKGEYQTSHLFFSKAIQMRRPASDRLFIEEQIYRFLLPLEFAVSCFYVGDHKSAIKFNNQLLCDPSMPTSMIGQVTKNRRFSLDALFPFPNSPTEISSFKICVPFRDPGAGLDDLIESIQRQEITDFEVTFIDDGSKESHDHRLPLDDKRFSLKKYKSTQGWDRRLSDFLSRHCTTDSIVLALQADDRLDSRNALKQAGIVFGDLSCMLVYGRHRLKSGTMNNAQPANDESDFNEQLHGLVGNAPVFFRAALFDSVKEQKNQKSSTRRAVEPPRGTLISNIIRAASFHGVRFTDSVLTAATPDNTAAVLTQMKPENLFRKYPLLEALPAPPKISCLMVTLDRLGLAKRSIQCFASQSYPNKELVIVTDGTERFRDALMRFSRDLNLDSVRLVVPDEEGLALGHLRNLSLDSSDGDIICQWDDDDCNHPDRLLIQAEYMLKEDSQACFFADHLQFLQDEQIVVWVDWTLDQRPDAEQLFPGSVMMYRDPKFRYPETGQFARRGEDSVFLSSILANLPVASLAGMGHLYLYTFHGRNTFSKEHHHHLSAYSRESSDITEREVVLRNALAHFPIAKPVVVGGRDGPAFVVNE